MNPVEKSATQPQLVVTFNRNIAIFTLIALPLLLGLGVWQLNRAADKRELQAEYAIRQAQPPVVLTSENIQEIADHQRIFALGSFDNEHTWLLDNKQRHGQVGYEILSPFILEDGQRLLVNRGWLAAGNSRDSLPQIEAISGTHTLFAELATVSKHPLLDAKSENNNWPKLIMAIDLETMAQHAGKELLPRYLRLDESSTGAFLTQWQPINVSADKHMGYAVQWFAMSIALIIWFMFANTNLLNYWRSRRESPINAMKNKG